MQADAVAFAVDEERDEAMLADRRLGHRHRPADLGHARQRGREVRPANRYTSVPLSCGVICAMRTKAPEG